MWLEYKVARGGNGETRHRVLQEYKDPLKGPSKTEPMTVRAEKNGFSQGKEHAERHEDMNHHDASRELHVIQFG